MGAISSGFPRSTSPIYGANQTTAASSKDSSATPRDSRGDDDEELPTTARSGVGTTSTSLPGAGLAGARLHVSFEFYNVPRLSAIATRKDEIYTDHINVSGTGFVARGKVIVRFLKDASRAVNARPTKKLNDRSMKWPTEFDKFGKERPQAIDMVGLVLEPALITCATPAMLPPNSRCLVQLSLNSGHDFTEMMPFTVRNAPVLESVHPSCGTLTGGTPIKIRGRNFTDSSKICVRFRLPDEARATEGESPQHEFTTVDANCVDERTIEVKLPPFDDVVQRTDQSDCVEEDTRRRAALEAEPQIGRTRRHWRSSMCALSAARATRIGPCASTCTTTCRSCNTCGPSRARRMAAQSSTCSERASSAPTPLRYACCRCRLKTRRHPRARPRPPPRLMAAPRSRARVETRGLRSKSRS